MLPVHTQATCSRPLSQLSHSGLNNKYKLNALVFEEKFSNADLASKIHTAKMTGDVEIETGLKEIQVLLQAFVPLAFPN